MNPRQDEWRLAELEEPAGPEKGMKFWVQTGSHWGIGENYSISRVNDRSFYVAGDGRVRRHPRAEWALWLRERAGEGSLSLDGHPIRLRGEDEMAEGQGALRFASLAQGAELRGQRDARIFRAVREVLRAYKIEELAAGEGGARRFRVARRGSEYAVEVMADWSARPRCDCPDARRHEGGGGEMFCKHVVAVLLSHPELRHQLIDLFL